MDEKINEKDLETQTPAAETEVTETVTEETPAAPEEQVSARDKFRSRVSASHPELNMDDEEAYFGQLGKDMDEYEGYKKDVQSLRKTMADNEEAAKFFGYLKDNPGVDPADWLFNESGVDWEAVMEDPDPQSKFAESRKKHLEKIALGKEIDKAIADNAPKTIAMTNAMKEKYNLTDEQVDNIMTEIFADMERAIRFDVTPEAFEAKVKALNYDADIASAREEGKAEGLNTKVEDKLRVLDETKENIPGGQTPIKPAEPSRKQRNMFVDD